jgi:hypothetical protein
MPINDNGQASEEVSLYGKNARAGDTPVSVDATGKINTNVVGALPTGPNLIGGTYIDQTTPGSTNAITQVVVSNSGTIGALNAAVTVTAGTVAMGTWAITVTAGGAMNLMFEGTSDGTNWFSLNGSLQGFTALTQVDVQNFRNSIGVSTNQSGTWMGSAVGLTAVRVRAYTWVAGTSGTITLLLSPYPYVNPYGTVVVGIDTNFGNVKTLSDGTPSSRNYSGTLFPNAPVWGGTGTIGWLSGLHYYADQLNNSIFGQPGSFGSGTVLDLLTYIKGYLDEDRQRYRLRNLYGSISATPVVIAAGVNPWKLLDSRPVLSGQMLVFKSVTGIFSSTGGFIRFGDRIQFGTLTGNGGTGAFANGANGADTSDTFAELWMEMTTSTNNTTARAVTVTYLDDGGVSRTATATLPASSALNARIPIVLNAASNGCQDVTNVSIDGATYTAGRVLTVYGFRTFGILSTSLPTVSGDGQGVGYVGDPTTGMRWACLEYTATAVTAQVFVGTATMYDTNIAY